MGAKAVHLILPPSIFSSLSIKQPHERNGLWMETGDFLKLDIQIVL